MNFFQRLIARLRNIIPNPYPFTTTIAELPRTDIEAFQRDARAIQSDWGTVGEDLDAAREKVLNGRIIMVSYDHHLHEVLEERSQAHRMHSGTLRCRRIFLSHGSNMILAKARALTCPDCLAERARLN